ncbi:small nuclease [Toxoplasma gondii GAB2-2007-GAL-DOM2]|uniref:Small nuclease n=3 Tax=Toxoplasma gondii TaxID=5811 RepID=A0A086LGK0_TOXGO|nr:small nuclease [Toxoplasma gondii GAB2-2007-GAL-DOM2]KFG55768.1 small nuclease [Toxoplasma gondii FOU]PUA91952.1 small nuclease [Toxoplasma gondii TgCATBr9]
MRLFPRFSHPPLSKTTTVLLKHPLCAWDSRSIRSQDCVAGELGRCLSGPRRTNSFQVNWSQWSKRCGGVFFTTFEEKPVLYQASLKSVSTRTEFHDPCHGRRVNYHQNTPALLTASSGAHSRRVDKLGLSLLTGCDLHFHSLHSQFASAEMEGMMEAPARFKSVSSEDANRIAPIRTAITITEDEETLQTPIVWVDCEMTGLDVETDQIIEIAVIVTDGQCKKRIVGPNLIVHASDELLDGMDDWCKKTHGESGLTAACRKSTLTLADAEEQILEFVQKHVATTRVAPLGGNSVHVDRQFLVKQMPRLIAHLSYRIIDVSTIKELAMRWKPELPLVKKAANHRALEDIHESIDELLYYTRHLFRVDQ